MRATWVIGDVMAVFAKRFCRNCMPQHGKAAAELCVAIKHVLGLDGP